MAEWAVLAAAIGVVPGCMNTAESPSQVRSQAGQVALMIGSQMGASRLTEASLIQIVESNGGGYVTAITRSGRAGTASERTVVHAVLGTSIVAGGGGSGGLGKPVGGTPAIRCYRFTVGYYPYQVRQAQEPCNPPAQASAGGFAAMATTAASRVWSAQNSISKLPPPAQAAINTAPVSRSQAARVLGLDRHASRVAGILPITAGQFAVGHGRAGVALQLRAGGCIYLSLPDNPQADGLPGPWLGPVHAPCTGAAALAASGWISSDPTAGG
jgi:hypothetical protein